MAKEVLGEVISLGEDAYAVRYKNYVSMFIVTDEGVIVVDPSGQATPKMPGLVKSAIETITDAPVKYVVYTHWGADHASGGAVFKDTATFIAHENVKPLVEAKGDPLTPVPDVTFRDNYAVKLGGRQLDLYPAKFYDKDTYALAHYAPAKVMMFVDLVQPENLPFRTLVGHPDRIIETLQWAQDNLDFDTQISGHATPHTFGTKGDFAAMKGYYQDLTDAIEAARGRGIADDSPEMLAAAREAMAPKYGTWGRFEMFDDNVRGMIGWRNGTITARP